LKVAVQIQCHGTEKAGATGAKHGTQDVFFIRMHPHPSCSHQRQSSRKQARGTTFCQAVAKKTRGSPDASPRESKAATVPRSCQGRRPSCEERRNISQRSGGDARRGSSPCHRHARAMMAGTLVYLVTGNSWNRAVTTRRDTTSSGCSCPSMQELGGRRAADGDDGALANES
jgi:hypothetical protein